MRKLIAGTGWKMNLDAGQTRDYARRLLPLIAHIPPENIETYVLPPFTSLHAAKEAFKDSQVSYGGQNMHWESSGSWTGEISADMLQEAGCRYVELAHSERLEHFGETYERVGTKVDLALEKGLTPIICLGETAKEKAAGRSDEVLAYQVLTSLSGQPDENVAKAILAYEPRWAISGSEAASPDYIAMRHKAIREILAIHRGKDAAENTRIIYGGSVTSENGKQIICLSDVDGLFVGRAAWTAEGFADIVKVVAAAADKKRSG